LTVSSSELEGGLFGVHLLVPVTSGTLAAAGEVAEWSKALAWKVSNILKGVRGFDKIAWSDFGRAQRAR